MISTFASPRRVKVDTGIEGAFDGLEDRIVGEGVAIAVRVIEAGWFSSTKTSFLIVVDGGTVGWVKMEYCKFPDLPER